MTSELQRLRETLERLVARLERDVAAHERDLAFEQALAAALVELEAAAAPSHGPLIVLPAIPEELPSPLHPRDAIVLLERRAGALERRHEALRAASRLMDGALETLLFRSEVPIVVRTPRQRVVANTRGAPILAAINANGADAREGLFEWATRAPLGTSDLPHERAARGERIDAMRVVLRFVGDGDAVPMIVGARPLPHGGGVAAFRPLVAAETRWSEEVTAS